MGRLLLRFVLSYFAFFLTAGGMALHSGDPTALGIVFLFAIVSFLPLLTLVLWIYDPIEAYLQKRGLSRLRLPVTLVIGAASMPTLLLVSVLRSSPYAADLRPFLVWTLPGATWALAWALTGWLPKRRRRHAD